MMLLQNKSLAKHRQTQNQRRGVQCLTTKPQTLHSVVFFIHSKYVFLLSKTKMFNIVPVHHLKRGKQ